MTAPRHNCTSDRADRKRVTVPPTAQEASMRPLPRLVVPVVLMTAACESVAGPALRERPATLRASTQQGTHTKVLPNVDGSFGPAVLASCAEGYDLIFQFTGTVTIIETIDQAGSITKLQNVWN